MRIEIWGVGSDHIRGCALFISNIIIERNIIALLGYCCAVPGSIAHVAEMRSEFQTSAVSASSIQRRSLQLAAT